MSDPTPIHIMSNRDTYIREHVILALLGAVLMTGYLALTESSSLWVGVVGAFAAIGIRGFYLYKEQLGNVWTLADQSLVLPNGTAIPFSEIKAVRGIFSAVQVVTTDGSKHLIRYQADRAGVIKTISTACNLPVK
ncbi:MAG: hypothetical protein COA53_03055 [Rhodobacteraceae bacterium]|nr:MAG: hypothetical protein COA53_03055 [Paracoccaceae bacterium]